MPEKIGGDISPEKEKNVESILNRIVVVHKEWGHLCEIHPKDGERREDIFPKILRAIRGATRRTALALMETVRDDLHTRVLRAVANGEPADYKDISWFTTTWEGKGDTIDSRVTAVIEANSFGVLAERKLEKWLKERAAGSMNKSDRKAMESQIIDLAEKLAYATNQKFEDWLATHRYVSESSEE